MIYIYHYTDSKGYHEVCRYTPPAGHNGFECAVAATGLYNTLLANGGREFGLEVIKVPKALP